MASGFRLLTIATLFISISSTTSLSSDTSDALTLPITKDGNTLQYTTHIHQGTSPISKKLVIDLGGPFLWTDECMSSSYKSVQCRSIQCSTANANTCRVGCEESCHLPAKNTVTGMVMRGELSEDIIRMESMSTADRFLFSCVPALLLEGLPSGARGMVGLGRNRISLPSQLAQVSGFNYKFFVCLPSSTESKGVILFDTSPYVKPYEVMRNTDSSYKNTLAKVAKSLFYTPLLIKGTDPSSTQDYSEYYIGVKAIKINGRQLSITEHNMGAAKLSTTIPYTTLRTPIYNTFVSAFTEAATLLFNTTTVASVAPFEICFTSQHVDKTIFGPKVPSIDLVLQSKMMKWRIYGANSMVQVSDGVMCLGVLNGGMNARDPIVIGGYQLENNLLEFDLASSRIGFTSLLTRQIKCSDFNAHGESSKSDRAS